MKKFLLALAIIVSITVLGCSKKDGGAAADGGSAEKVTIVVGGWPSADVAFESILPGFNAKYPNINVDIQMQDTTAYHQALQTSLAAGSGAPDVAMVEGAYIAQYRDSMAVENLLAEPYNAGKYQNDFVKMKWDQAISSDGKRMVAFSWDIGPSVIYYRHDIFREVGLPSEPDDVAKYMESWPNVLEAARKVHIPGERWLLTEAQTLYMDFFHNRDYYNENLELQLDRAGDIDCLDVVIAMRRGGLDMNANIWSPEGTAAVNNGAVCTVILGSWFGGFLKDDFDPDGIGNWRAAQLPGGVRGQGQGGSFCMIPAQSKHKAEAWAFMEYALITKEGQNKMFETVDYFPAYQPAWDDPIYQAPDPYFGGQKTRALYTEVANLLDVPIYTTIMDVATEGAISGAITTGIDQGMNSAQLKDFIRREVDANTAELKRQQIQILNDAGVWKGN